MKTSYVGKPSKVYPCLGPKDAGSRLSSKENGWIGKDILKCCVQYIQLAEWPSHIDPLIKMILAHSAWMNRKTGIYWFRSDSLMYSKQRWGRTGWEAVPPCKLHDTPAIRLASASLKRTGLQIGSCPLSDDNGRGKKIIMLRHQDNF